MTITVPFVDLAALHAGLQAELDDAWQRVTSLDAFVGGIHVERFESDWAAASGCRHAVGVGNGTDALTLVLLGLGIGRGDEVIVPANTFIATAEAVVAAGATPVFVDVDPDTLLITSQTIEIGLSAKTAAVIVVHLFGQPANVREISELADRAGIAVIEDAAQAHGASWEGRPAGSLGVAGTFSFYPSKNLGALGDGGAVVTNDSELAGRIRSLSNHGTSRQ